MQGNPRVIEMLNEVLTAELTAINEYFIHAKMCGNWGYRRLEHRVRDESIDEMKHAESLIERILYLEGTPNLQRLGSVRVGETVPEQFQVDLELEYAAIDRLNGFVEECRALGDNGTRELFEHILVSEEEHADWLETQQEAIAQVGLQNYLSQQLHHED